MFKLFSIGSRTADKAAVVRQQPSWCRDPLLHPLLREMTQRELGDLPFPAIDDEPDAPTTARC